MTAIRRRVNAKTWTTAALVGVLVAAGTLLASQASLVGDQSGIGDRTLLLPAALLFVVGFGTGLQTAVLALCGALVGLTAVGMAESWRWYYSAGVYLFDGETMKESGPLGAALDFVDPFFMFLHVAIWLPAAVLGATAGTWWWRRRLLVE
jgi:hypothetical protein